MGYNLPVFGADGIFGSETEAAVERFQRDANAVLIDGIVGPETMGLFDRHDTTRPGGVGPPATTGPLPGPRPPTRRGCEVPFAGVTFPPVTQNGRGASPAANIRIVMNGGRPFLFMEGINSAVWQPQVTINAPDDPTAREFEVGFIQNLLTERVEYTYTSAVQVVSTLPTPIKDGAPLRTGAYHAIFVETGALNPNARQNFASNGDTRTLNWQDVPSDGAFINLLDNPTCGPPFAPATMLTAAFIDDFRLWLAVRHRPSGCVVPLKHIDWDLDWEANIRGGTVIVTRNVINVTVPSGDGSPTFIQGGQVPGDLLATSRVCRYGRCVIVPVFTRVGRDR
jgi:peptidoglycan hydrolase-like protein with peptidoglycan-binding domain